MDDTDPWSVTEMLTHGECKLQNVIQGISSKTHGFMDHVVLYSLNDIFVSYVVYQPPGPWVKAN